MGGSPSKLLYSFFHFYFKRTFFGDALCPKIAGQASLLSKKLLSLLTATTSTCDTISKTIYFKMFINIINGKIFPSVLLSSNKNCCNSYNCCKITN